jgi:hypothetical protein
MEDKIYSVLEKYGIDEPKASAITEDLLVLCAVSQQRELLDLLTEIANSDTLYSNTRHRMIARKLLKSNCG